MSDLDPPAGDRIERLRLVTRGYEVASSGQIPPSQLLRYMEHLRWRRMGAGGPSARPLFAAGVVRAQALELFGAVGFDVELEVSMWVGRVGKTSLDFSQEITEVGSGALVARGTTTVVSLDADRNPAVIDPRARAYVVARDAAVIERLEVDGQSGWERPIQVRPSDEDLQGHVNQARYADFVEDTRKLCAAAGGYGPGSWDGPVRRLVISYEREARTSDPLLCRTFRSRHQEHTLEFVLSKGGSEIVTLARVEVAGH